MPFNSLTQSKIFFFKLMKLSIITNNRSSKL